MLQGNLFSKYHITSETSLHKIAQKRCITWPVFEEVIVMFLEACVTKKQLMCQCIFQGPLIVTIRVWLTMPNNTLVNAYVDLVVFTRIAGTS